VKVRREHTAMGWEVRTVDLPSVAEKGAPRYGMHDDADVIRDHIKQIQRPVVLVAHSCSGTPVTEGAVGLPNVWHIIYLAEFQPDVGESQLGSANGQAAPWWLIDGDTLTAGTPRQIFYGDLSLEDADWAIAQLKPQSFAAPTGSGARRRALTPWRSASPPDRSLGVEAGIDQRLIRRIGAAQAYRSTACWIDDGDAGLRRAAHR
jgi:hypothetical protein